MSSKIIPTHVKFFRPETGSVRTLPMTGDLAKAQVIMILAIKMEDISLRMDDPVERKWFMERSDKLCSRATDLVREHWLDLHMEQMGELTEEVASWVFYSYVFNNDEEK